MACWHLGCRVGKVIMKFPHRKARIMRTLFAPVIQLIHNQRGMALVMSLLMLVLMSILGVAIINISGTDLKTASYEKMSTLAFSSAESGLTQARNDMQAYILANQSGQWPASDDTVITNVMQGSNGTLVTDNGTNYRQYTPTIGGVNMTFRYSITQFGTDTDLTVLVRSEGIKQNVQQRVEAVIEYEPPSSIGAQECYNSKCTSEDQSSGSNVNFSGSTNSSVNL